MKIPYTIQIDGTDNGGFIVQVGCRRLTFTSRESLVDALREYLGDPQGVAERFAETFGWSSDPIAPPVATAIQPATASDRGFRTASEVLSGEPASIHGSR